MSMISTAEFDHFFIPAKKPLARSQDKLMIVLHGRGDSLEPFQEFDKEMGMPEMNYLLINAPRKYDGGYTWYAFPPNQRLGVLKAREKLTRLLQELQEQGWRTENIFFFGFSQGCLVSCDLGMNLPYRLGGIIGVSGYLYFFPRWRQKLTSHSFTTPWLITHGTEDIDLEIDETRRDVKKLLEAKLPVRWEEFSKEHEIEPEKEIPLMRQWIRQQYSKKSPSASKTSRTSPGRRSRDQRPSPAL